MEAPRRVRGTKPMYPENPGRVGGSVVMGKIWHDMAYGREIGLWDVRAENCDGALQRKGGAFHLKRYALADRRRF